MPNPYQVLGVDPSAPEETVKEAYRRLAEKYSAENYAGNPLADLAENKMKGINDAYDQIMSERRVGSASPNDASGYASSGSFPGYTGIRELINANHPDEAESRLLQIPLGDRNAEWNFLMGSVNYAKGWLDEADRYFSLAASMDPSNREYEAAFNRVRGRKRGRAPGHPYGGYNTYDDHSGNCSGCDICTGLMCADCLCNCLGGRGFCC